ncbi:MAG: imidazole glycerol phosphate synthase subunit HisH [Castellaniella sp.]|uniref:imidazole glycerol phosphate synthase subunit HisH n=1 Tax=Castellaniella sp. TaxID=1955812 RepID=UPI003C715AE7
MKKISVLDYGCGNIRSVIRMLEKAGAPAHCVSTPEAVRDAQAVVLPGVGAFDHGMQAVRDRGLDHALDAVVQEGRVPVLGICLGMQLMCRGSEEGTLPGLGWFDAQATRFPDPGLTRLPVPHMGWNTLHIAKENALLSADEPDQRFYFVHSYRIQCNDPADVVATCDYGGSFVAAFSKANLFGAQFHPEKSHRFGLAMMRRFVEWVHVAA